MEEKKITLCRCVTRGGEKAGGRPCFFLETGKKHPDFRKKRPDCGHLWVKFLI